MNRKTLLVTFWARFKRGVRYYAHGLYEEISTKDLFLWAQAIAFKVLVTVVPVLALATGITAQVLRASQPLDQVASFVRDFFPPAQSEQLIQFLTQLYDASDAITVVGAAGLFISAWSLLTTLRSAVSNAFEQDWSVSRTIIGGYLFDARMAVQVGLLFTLTIGLSVFAQSLESGLILRWLDLDYTWIRQGWRSVFRLISLLAPFLISTAMFFQLFYFVPQPHPRKRSALVGAFITAMLWEVTKQGFAFYATYVGQFDRYQNGGEGLAALGSVFGLIIAFVIWVYFSAIVLMLGAVIVSLHERHFRLHQPFSGAAHEPEATTEAPSREPSTAPNVPEPTPAHRPRPSKQ